MKAAPHRGVWGEGGGGGTDIGAAPRTDRCSFLLLPAEESLALLGATPGRVSAGGGGGRSCIVL